ncbi:uncharacterized protein [Mytilus edulis]|uniref:uncharacterized protein n=1 Tax=Mytilus edulis TaxID=6550 RepID=UPI0039EDEB3F
MTFPKLELMAAVIGAQMAKNLTKTLEPQQRRVLLSDSQIVLHWISSIKPFGRFVQNRVLEIKETTQNYDWKYVPTESNPAYLQTREISSTQFKESTLRMQGLSSISDDNTSLGSKITDNVSKLTGELDGIKLEQMEVIPKNIRDQMLKDFEKWLQDDTKFVPTTASEYVISCLKKENCVSVVGSPGVGKTAVTRHVALKMKEQGYTVIPITVPTDIRDFYQPGQQTVFIIDDMGGKFTANKQLIDTWKQLLGVVDNILSDNCKIIVSIRSQVYKDTQFCVLSQFRSCECNLISHNLLLSKDERIQIAKAHLGKHGNDIPEAMLLKYDFFPLLCFLFSRQENMDINNFFNNPFVVFEKELNSLWNEGEVGQCKICGLALCVIYNNKLDEKYLTSMESCVRDIIDDVCEACGINRGTSRIKIKEELDTLVGTYLKKENNIYITIHDKLFDFLVYFYGTKMLDCLIKHAMTDIINQRFRWNKFRNNEDKDTDEFIIIIPEDKLTLYLNRLILDWSNGKFVDLFSNNYNMENEQFRDSLLTQLLHRDKAEQLHLTRITEMCENGFAFGSLEACCWGGHANLLPWFVDQGVEINRCSTCYFTPLSFSCLNNKKEVINTLLNFGADINKQGTFGCTCLHVSCESNVDPAVLDLLLKNKSCINKQTYDGETPLLLALYENNREAVKVLLSHSADCNIGFYDSQTIKDGLREAEKLVKTITIENEENAWLHWFTKMCQSSVVDYVNQEPTKITNIIGGATPVHLMCFTNDIDMIRLLLERNADINIRKEDGSTPLFVACLFGFIDITTILLEHGANRDICRNDGTSPLDIAKQKNHFEIISLLENPKYYLAKSDKIKNKSQCIVL